MSALPGGIYLVVDAAVCAASGHRPEDVAAAAVGAGVRVVQVRAKGAGSRELVRLVLAVARAAHAAAPVTTRRDAVRVVVDDRVDVALAARAQGAPVDGVHVGQRDLDPADARALLGPSALVGVSAARLGDVRAVVPGTADYLGAGPVHATVTKPDAGPPLGYVGLAAVVRASALPVVAIGGLEEADVAAVRACSAAGQAVVSAICAAPDPGAAAGRLVDAWAAARAGARAVAGARR